MSIQSRTKDLSKYPHEVIVEACPSELLKSVESLKDMGFTNAVIELSFKTITELEIFTRILNREQDEERIANELKVTYFHNVRGKIKRTELTKNEEFTTMKKIRFNSAYHVTLFLKYYEHRIKQLENEYGYTITNGREGFLYVYLNEENISSMFVNEIRDMKKRLNFLEMKDQEVCERFKYSEKLAQQLNNACLFNEIWYRGRDSTMIFYSEKHTLSKMKDQIREVTRFHITILKMTDNRFPFLVNYFLFQQLKKLFWPEVRKLDSVDINQIEFNQNKVAIVVHDMHEVFTAEIKSEILEKMKRFVLVTYRARFARGYLNWLKKNCYFDEALSFSYSKKTVCMCINLEKVRSYDDIRKMFSPIGESMNSKSQITLNWLHLQEAELSEYRRQLALRIISTLSGSTFYIENYGRLAVNKDLKCIIRLKGDTFSVEKKSEAVGEVVAQCIAVWNNKDIVGKNFVEKVEENVEVGTGEKNVEENDDEDESEESEYDEDEVYDEEPNGDNKNEESEQNPANTNQDPVTQQSVQTTHQASIQTAQCEPLRRGFKQNSILTHKIMAYVKESNPKYFQSDKADEWKTEKCWRSLEDELLTEVRIHFRIKKVQIGEHLKQNVDEMLTNMRKEPEETVLLFHIFDSYSPLMYESPYFKPNQEQRVHTFNDLKVGQKFVICCEMNDEQKVLSYPVCSLEVLKRF